MFNKLVIKLWVRSGEILCRIGGHNWMCVEASRDTSRELNRLHRYSGYKSTIKCCTDCCRLEEKPQYGKWKRIGSVAPILKKYDQTEDI